jgi:hypothetical protein
LKDHRLVGAFALLIASLCVYGASSYTEGAWQLVTPSSRSMPRATPTASRSWRAQPEPIRQATYYCRQRLVTKYVADLPATAAGARSTASLSDCGPTWLGDWSTCVNGSQTRASRERAQRGDSRRRTAARRARRSPAASVESRSVQRWIRLRSSTRRPPARVIVNAGESIGAALAKLQPAARSS